MNKSDFRNLSLQLYGKEVEITIKENSPSLRLFNTSFIKGILIGRFWGDKLVNAKHEETVIALTIQTGNEEIEIPCHDIELLQPAKPTGST
jgi:hypothetical protein